MRGSYIYLLDGRQTQIEETFRIDGQLWLSTRRAAGTTLTVEAAQTPGGGFDDVRVSFRTETGCRDLAIVRERGRWCWELSFESGGPVSETVDGTAYVFALLRCFQGHAVQAIHAGGTDGLLVAVPDITVPSGHERLLRPRLDLRRVSRGDEGWFDYVGGSYEHGAACLVGADGLLERYTWDQPGVGVWDVRLDRGQ
jgi:hypothetical protein